MKETSGKFHSMLLLLVPLVCGFSIGFSKTSSRHHRGQYAAPKMFPSFNRCRKDMTNGERRVAKRLLEKCADDVLLWYDVPIGKKSRYPDFIVFNPKSGIMILEVKDNCLSKVIKADKKTWEIDTPTGRKTKSNPMEQARKNVFAVKEELEKKTELLNSNGNLIIPWTYGVVFSNIKRKNLEGTSLLKTIDAKKIICKDEISGNVNKEDFQTRLDNMFEYKQRGSTLSLRQLDLIRYQIFPEYRIPQKLRSAISPSKQVINVMDLQQEQFARNIGSGHRVIHGVAGSGKTVLILHRARELAKSSSSRKPILILCYNKPLANFLSAEVEAKAKVVQVCHFHKWCRDQLVANNLPLANKFQPVDTMMRDMVDRVIEGVKEGEIARQQYQAILIDEAHDFEPEWLQLMAEDMLDHTTNDLLVVYDDAQNIYRKESKKILSFKSVGIEARGRTTIFRVNYRNTRQILETVLSVDDANVLGERTSHEDGIPQVHPVASIREGDFPIMINASCLQEEITKIGNCFRKSKDEGYEWLDMATLCRNQYQMELCAKILTKLRIPNEKRTAGSFDPQSNSVKLLTMHACKGLQFPLVAIVGVGNMKNTEDEIKLFHVAGTRARDCLFLGISGNGPFSKKLLSFKDLKGF